MTELYNPDTFCFTLLKYYSKSLKGNMEMLRGVLSDVMTEYMLEKVGKQIERVNEDLSEFEIAVNDSLNELNKMNISIREWIEAHGED